MAEKKDKDKPTIVRLGDESEDPSAPFFISSERFVPLHDYRPVKPGNVIYLSDNYDRAFLPSGQFVHVPDSATAEKTRELVNDIARLRREVEEKSAQIHAEKLSGKKKEEAIAALEKKVAELAQQEKLGFLLSRVRPEAHAKLLVSEDFQREFLEPRECSIYVMSVDIRRSTDLMLKARSPEMFATFITTLCRDLESIVKASYGVFDKFTGDGILAFFPEFYSGSDAAYWTIAAADQCHDAFNKRYKEFRSSFTTVLTSVGLGIGIDYGPAHLVQMAGGLTVVGAPVVYACRMGGAPAGATLLNQPAYEKIGAKFSSYCFLRETELDFKHEGRTLAYSVELNRNTYEPALPDWVVPSPV